jgi:hypothetical protein
MRVIMEMNKPHGAAYNQGEIPNSNLQILNKIQILRPTIKINYL